MVFLSKIQLNPGRRETLRLLASPQRVHAAVLGAFPPDLLTEATSRVLWRLDQPKRHELNLYVVSAHRPSLESLEEGCGWSQQPSGRVADYRPLLDGLEAGQRWVFRLTANPVRSSSEGQGQRGKVKPHLSAAHQLEWLTTRGDRHGFTVSGGADDPTVQATRRTRDTFVKGTGPDKQLPTITRVQFDGVLSVTDPEVLRSALVHGIGRAKAYGCGLMTLAPAR